MNGSVLIEPVMAMEADGKMEMCVSHQSPVFYIKRCDQCDYKTVRNDNLNRHKIWKHHVQMSGVSLSYVSLGQWYITNVTINHLIFIVNIFHSSLIHCLILTNCEAYHTAMCTGHNNIHFVHIKKTFCLFVCISQAFSQLYSVHYKLSQLSNIHLICVTALDFVEA